MIPNVLRNYIGIEMKQLKTALFGSSSHIAKGLIWNFLRNGNYELHLYTRNPDKVQSFINSISRQAQKKCFVHKGYRNFKKSSTDIIINCVGAGTLRKNPNVYTDYFTITEEYDNLAIEYLRNYRPNALYICMSSGAVYGSNFSTPANDNSINGIKVNHLSVEDYYAITRLNSEAKHRAFTGLNIVDLRIFSYFSRFADLSEGYFITDMLTAIQKGKTFETSGENIIRDYLHHKDFFSMIKLCIKARKLNTVLDVASTKPVDKFKILDYFSSKYGLKYKISKLLPQTSPTGAKRLYYSVNKNASIIGYKPVFNSLDTITMESKYVLRNSK